MTYQELQTELLSLVEQGEAIAIIGKDGHIRYKHSSNATETDIANQLTPNEIKTLLATGEAE